MCRVVIVLFCCLQTIGFSQGQVESANTHRNLSIGSMDDKSILDGCGCSFTRFTTNQERLNPPFYYLRSVDSKKAWMKLDGRITELTLLEMSNKAPLYEIFTDGAYTVRADYYVTKLSSEDIEFTWFYVDLTVSKGKAKKVFRVSGGCGC